MTVAQIYTGQPASQLFFHRHKDLSLPLFDMSHIPPLSLSLSLPRWKLQRENRRNNYLLSFSYVTSFSLCCIVVLGKTVGFLFTYLFLLSAPTPYLSSNMNHWKRNILYMIRVLYELSHSCFFPWC